MISVLLCVVASSVMAQEECNFVGKDMTDFDMTGFYGTWFNKFHAPEEFEENYKCWNETYSKFDDTNEYVNSTVFSQKEKAPIQTTGKAAVTANIIDILYDNKELKDLSTKYHVLDTDYGNFSIVGGYTKKFEKPLMFIAFRTPYPTEEIIKKAEEALKAKDIKEKFVRDC